MVTIRQMYSNALYLQVKQQGRNATKNWSSAIEAKVIMWDIQASANQAEVTFAKKPFISCFTQRKSDSHSVRVITKEENLVRLISFTECHCASNYALLRAKVKEN